MSRDFVNNIVTTMKVVSNTQCKNITILDYENKYFKVNVDAGINPKDKEATISLNIKIL